MIFPHVNLIKISQLCYAEFSKTTCIWLMDADGWFLYLLHRLPIQQVAEFQPGWGFHNIILKNFELGMIISCFMTFFMGVNAIFHVGVDVDHQEA